MVNTLPTDNAEEEEEEEEEEVRNNIEEDRNQSNTTVSQQRNGQTYIANDTETWTLDEDPYELGPIYLHRWVDTQDAYHKWYEAQIIELDIQTNVSYNYYNANNKYRQSSITTTNTINTTNTNNTNNTNNNNNNNNNTTTNTENDQKKPSKYSRFRIKVHYKGWKPKFDEWIDLLSGDNNRVRSLHTFVPRPSMDARYILHPTEKARLKAGDQIDCLDACDVWYPATIVQETSYLYLIHYNNWSERYNEWINKDSYRFARFHTMSKKNSKNEVSEDKGKDVVMSERRSATTTNSYSTPIVTTSFPYTSSSLQSHPQPMVDITNTNKNKNKEEEDDDEKNANIQNTHTAVATGSGNSRNRLHISNDTQGNESDSEQKSETVIEADNANNEKKEEENDSTMNENVTDKEKYRNAYLSNFKPSREDEQRFRSIMENRGWRIVDMGEDGSCLFRSISHQIYGDEKHHNIVRQKCVDYLQCQKSYFSNFIVMDFDTYCQFMRRNGVWGGNVEIQAFSEIYDRPINIYAYSDRPMRTFNENNNKNNKPPIFLSYHFNSHYNSIVDTRVQAPLLSRPPGEFEDEKIKLTTLRSIRTLKQTVETSDVNATDAELFAAAIQESRRAFESGDKMGQEQLDAAIQASLEQIEKEDQKQMKKVLAMSMAENTENTNNQMPDKLPELLDKIEDTEIQQALLKSMEANPDTYMTAITVQADDNSWPTAVKTVVKEFGYTFEEAMEAYSIFESACRELGNETLMQQMIEYLSQKRQQFGW